VNFDADNLIERDFLNYLPNESGLELKFICDILYLHLDNGVEIMKAILTTVGQDQVGIIAGVSNYLAKQKINILDVSQTIMNGYFTMMMMVEVPTEGLDFTAVATDLKDLGSKLGVEINIRNADLYQAMHQL